LGNRQKTEVGREKRGRGNVRGGEFGVWWFGTQVEKERRKPGN